MINFFRKIRKQLADENKPLKYARYAIGEILLVVIGILIALSINNWNEDRRMFISQNDALEKLKHDLNYDIRILTNLDNLYDTWNDQAEFIIREVLDGSRSELISKDEYIIGRASMNYLTVRTTTFDGMINTGIFYQLEEDSLSQSISE